MWIRHGDWPQIIHKDAETVRQINESAHYLFGEGFTKHAAYVLRLYVDLAKAKSGLENALNILKDDNAPVRAAAALIRETLEDIHHGEPIGE